MKMFLVLLIMSAASLVSEIVFPKIAGRISAEGRGRGVLRRDRVDRAG
jgi:hypothetical protein